MIVAAIKIDQYALPVLLVSQPISFELTAIRELICALSIILAATKRAFISASISEVINAMTMSFALLPLTNILITVGPGHLTLTVKLSIKELPQISTPVSKFVPSVLDLFCDHLDIIKDCLKLVAYLSHQ